MQLGMWDILINMLLLAFWFRLWARDDRSMVFNPYLAPIIKVTDPVINFLRHAIPGIPVRSVTGLAFVLLIALRGVLASRLGPWVLSFGFQAWEANCSSIPRCVVFSFLSFGLFLFKLWGISLLYVRVTRASQFDNPVQCLYCLSCPFTIFSMELRPAVLFIVGMVSVYLLDALGLLTSHSIGMAGGVPGIIQRAVLVLAGWVNVLPLLMQFMMVLIIGSWVSMFTGSRGLMLFCRDWIDTLLGPLRRYPLRLGMIDLSPIIFFIGVGAIHGFVMMFLVQSYNAFL